MTDEERAQRLGEMIKKARLDARLSVRAAAKAANISEGRWRQLELGYQQVAEGVRVPARPRIDTLSAIARALGVNDLVLFDAAGLEVSPRGRVAFGRPPFNADIHIDLPTLGIEELARRAEKAADELSVYTRELSRRIHYQRVPDTTPPTKSMIDMAEWLQRDQQRTAGRVEEPKAARSGTPRQVEIDAAQPDPGVDSPHHDDPS